MLSKSGQGGKMEFNMTHLVNILSYNLLYKHLVNAQNVQFIKELKNMFLNESIFLKDLFPDTTEEKIDTKKRKVVVIIGSGASNEIEMPLAREAADQIKQYIFENKRLLSKKIFKEEVRRIKRVHGSKEDSFETIMQALCKYHGIESKVVKKLKSIFSLKYYPLLSYEIIAHLLKQRAIDVVINFNFDELLDQSIDDELKNDQYSKIIHDGDYEDFSRDRKKEEKPLYIKPHGTVSHPSTMRFTRDDYFEISGNIRRSIKESIKNASVFISIGFALESIDFNAILSTFFLNNADRKVCFYTIAKKQSEINLLELLSLNKQKDIKKYRKNINSIHIDMDIENFRGKYDGKTYLFLNMVANNIYDKFESNLNRIKEDKNIGIINTSLICPDITRHEVISSIFFVDKKFLEKLWEEAIDTHIGYTQKHKLFNLLKPDYLYLRSLIELSFMIVINKGRLNLSLMKNCRAGKYFDIYRKYVWKDYSILPEQESSYYLQTITRLCFLLKLQRPNYSFGLWEYHELMDDKNNGNNQDFLKIINNINDAFIKLREKYYNLNESKNSKLSTRKLKELKIKDKYIEHIIGNFNEQATQKKIIKLFEKRWKTPSKQIDHYRDGILPDIVKYDTYHQIKTRFGLIIDIRETITQENWDYIYIATHDPGWIFTNENMDIIYKNNHNVRIRLVVISDKLKVFRELFKNRQLDTKIKKINWTKHKRFILLCGYYQEDKIQRPEKIIYYDQNYLVPYILPFSLDLKQTFSIENEPIRKDAVNSAHTFLKIFCKYYSRTNRRRMRIMTPEDIYNDK